MYVTAKLHTMRKAQRFSVRPMSDGRVLIQSDKSTGVFDFRTREGVLNVKGCYFPHLSPALGAFRYTYPAEFVTACLEACPALDSTTVLASADGTVVVYAQNTVQVV